MIDDSKYFLFFSISMNSLITVWIILRTCFQIVTICKNMRKVFYRKATKGAIKVTSILDHLQCDGTRVDSSCIRKCHSCRLGGLGVNQFFEKEELSWCCLHRWTSSSYPNYVLYIWRIFLSGIKSSRAFLYGAKVLTLPNVHTKRKIVHCIST